MTAPDPAGDERMAVDVMRQLEEVFRGHPIDAAWMKENYGGKPIYEASKKIIVRALSLVRAEGVREGGI